MSWSYSYVVITMRMESDEGDTEERGEAMVATVANDVIGAIAWHGVGEASYNWVNGTTNACIEVSR